MTELIFHSLFRLTALFLVALALLFFLRRCEPFWRMALLRGVFIGGSLLLLTSLFSIECEIPGWKTGDAAPAVPSLVAKTPTIALTEGEVELAAVPVSKAEWGVTLPTYLGIAWLAGFGILLARLLGILLSERRVIRSGYSARGTLLKAWEQACSEIGARSRGFVIVSEPVSPHLTLGGQLVLPERVVGTGQSKELVHVLRHEAAHLRAGDHFWFPFVSVFTALLWFHPLAWWLAERHLVSCEEARDAAAARLGGVESYRRSVAQVALGLLPAPSPSLFRRNGRLVDRLNRVQDTTTQSPPLAAAILAAQGALIAAAILLGTAAPSVQAATDSQTLFGMWRAEAANNPFARQVEVYEWGDQVKLRLWHSLGNDGQLHGATISSTGKNRSEFDEQFSENLRISVPDDSGFSESIYTLSIDGPRLVFRVQTTYTDNSRRGDQDFVCYYERGNWSDGRE